MQTWVIYAIFSMLFASVTAILAKYGLQNVSADFGLGIRTTVIFVIVLAMNIVGANHKEFNQVTRLQLFLLVASGITTTLSWIFYYRAIKDGLVSYVTAIDKASVVVTILLAFIILKEPVTAKVLVGAALIFAGTVVLIWK